MKREGLREKDIQEGVEREEEHGDSPRVRNELREISHAIIIQHLLCSEHLRMPLRSHGRSDTVFTVNVGLGLCNKSFLVKDKGRPYISMFIGRSETGFLPNKQSLFHPQRLYLPGKRLFWNLNDPQNTFWTISVAWLNKMQCWSVHNFGSNWKISTTIGWITMDLYPDYLCVFCYSVALCV